MRHRIAKHHPPPTLAGHVHGFVAAVAGAEVLEGEAAGVVALYAAGASRRVVGVAEGGEEQGADRNPPDVDEEPAAEHGWYHTGPMERAEIERKLIEIVRSEKQIPDDKLTPGTALADAGVDSLDALTILFAIEEQFGISIPDDKARAIKTFGDMIDAVESLLPATS